jgi:hypothetical protein
MDTLFQENVEKIECVLKKLNPFQCLLTNGELKNIMSSSSNMMELTNEIKKKIKKAFYEWCRCNHPDKSEAQDEDSLFVYKVFGQAFLRFSEEQFQTTWMFMGFSAVTFHNLNIHMMQFSDVCHLLRDIEVLSDLADSCGIISQVESC